MNDYLDVQPTQNDSQDIQPTYFERERPDAGYIWEHEANTDFYPSSTGLKYGKGTEGKRIDGPFLIISPDTESYRKANLESETFKEFVELDYSEKKVLAFANKHGFLVDGETQITAPRFTDNNPPPQQRHTLRVNVTPDGTFYRVRGESLGLWQKEIEDMKFVHLVWEWYKEEKWQKLKKIINWHPNGELVRYVRGDINELDGAWKDDCKPGLSYCVLASTMINSSIFKRFTYGLLELPSLYLVQTSINEKLSDLRDVKPRLMINDKNKLEPYLVPSNLLAFMWLQFYKEVVGETKYKRCSVCRHWMDITDSRTTRKMHPKCRSQHRRNLIEETVKIYMDKYNEPKHKAEERLKKKKAHSRQTYEDILEIEKKKHDKQTKQNKESLRS